MDLLPRDRRNSPSRPRLRLFHEYRSLPIPARRIRRLALMIAENEGIRPSQAVAVVFCSDRTIKKLNARYRKIDRPTDVLSFTFDDTDILGEIYISLKRADVQSRRYGVPYDEEVSRLFIHGFLHLLGYDHEKESDRVIMERRERRYL